MVVRTTLGALLAAAILAGGRQLAGAPATSAELPPLIVEQDAPRLRGSTTETPVGSQPKPEAPPADNSACYVCHVNLREDSLTQDHAHANVGCANCHGESSAHVADEANLTPPDIMFSADQIASACGKCHRTHDAPAAAVVARWRECCADRADTQALLCTDCHGSHRSPSRSIVWNKKTRQLIRSGSPGAAPAGSYAAASLSAAFGKALGGGMVAEGRAEHRTRPVTVECWARLNSPREFNILVASDPKASAEHWELYSYAGSGVFSVYQPGRGGEFRSDANICDSRWHYLAAVLEPDRVRLFVDGRLVKDAAAKPMNGQPVPGELAFGRLVEGGIGCDGVVDEVRLSRGAREIAGLPKGPFTQDERTVGLWHFDDLPAGAVPRSGTHAVAAPPPPDLAPPDSLFARKNLVAWCIVPFDAGKRDPEQRAAMLERLGFRLFAYDYRAEHVPTFDAEMQALKRHHVELLAWWFPAAMNEEARLILDVLKRHNCHAQLWITGGGDPVKDEAEQRSRVEAEARRIRPIAQEAARIGCTVALYNHGGWFGEPENQIAIIDRLKTDGVTNVGIVYNLHHGHDHLDRFRTLLARMKPHLVALNLNGMTRNGNKILPLGQGDLDLELLRVIRDSGWRGPIGILNHTDADAEERLRDNLEGLNWLIPQLDGKPAGPRPTPRTWRAPAGP